jgi:hypothetical protein
VTIVPSDEQLFQRGMDLFRGRPDKDWPLTDCISFVVMGELGGRRRLPRDKRRAFARIGPISGLANRFDD